MKQDYNIEEIENYIYHKLPTAESEAFEQRMKLDSDLAAEVDFHKDILLGIDLHHEQALQDVFTNVATEMEQEGFFKEPVPAEVAKKETPVRRLFSIRSLSIAASVALLIAAGWWVFNQPVSPDDLYATYFEVHQDLLSAPVAERLEETGFGLDKERLAVLQQGMEAYQNKNYAQAIPTLKSYNATGPRDAFSNAADFYLALSYMATANISEAQSLLLLLSQESSFDMAVDAQWYLALSYLKQDEAHKAKLLLEGLQNQSNYGSDTKKILKKL